MSWTPPPLTSASSRHLGTNRPRYPPGRGQNRATARCPYFSQTWSRRVPALNPSRAFGDPRSRIPTHHHDLQGPGHPVPGCSGTSSSAPPLSGRWKCPPRLHCSFRPFSSQTFIPGIFGAASAVLRRARALSPRSRFPLIQRLSLLDILFLQVLSCPFTCLFVLYLREWKLMRAATSGGQVCKTVWVPTLLLVFVESANTQAWLYQPTYSIRIH